MKNLAVGLASVVASVGAVWAVSSAVDTSDNTSSVASDTLATLPPSPTSLEIVTDSDPSALWPPTDPAMIEVVYDESGVTVGLYTSESEFSSCMLVTADDAQAYTCFDSTTIANGLAFSIMQQSTGSPKLLVGLTGGSVTDVSVDGQLATLSGKVWVLAAPAGAAELSITLADGRVVTQSLDLTP